MSTRTKCPSGLIGWQGRLQAQYESQEEFESYSDIYSLAERLGYDSADSAWQSNPVVAGSTNPVDYRKASQ